MIRSQDEKRFEDLNWRCNLWFSNLDLVYRRQDALHLSWMMMRAACLWAWAVCSKFAPTGNNRSLLI